MISNAAPSPGPPGDYEEKTRRQPLLENAKPNKGSIPIGDSQPAAGGDINFVSRMDQETLRRGYKSLMEYIYSPGPFYERVRTFLREYRPPKISRSLDWRSLLAFVQANFRLGVLGRERFHYWALLFWTLLRRPSQLSLAVTLSIYGYHFRKTCRGIRP
jgi:hypothetical protein